MIKLLKIFVTYDNILESINDGIFWYILFMFWFTLLYLEINIIKRWYILMVRYGHLF